MRTCGSAAITLEYAIDDFAIAQFARMLGKMDAYQTYLERAHNWQHLFNGSMGYIEPRNADAVFWAMSYRCNPAVYISVVPYREPGHGPRTSDKPELDSALLIDATMKHPMPPLALPKREYM